MEPWEIRKFARLKARLKQHELAAKFDPPISRVAVGLWEKSPEKDGTAPDGKKLRLLSSLYGLTAGQLLGQESIDKDYFSDINALASIYTKINDVARRQVIEVPISATGGGMSHTGKAVAEYEMLAGSLPLDKNWIRHELPELSNPSNLAIMPGYGDSMLGTYNDGDLLFVDRGVSEVKLDAVYAFRNDGDMYIKRIQRLPTGTLKIISDNRKYESYEISKKQWKDFTMVGRVLGALNWNRM